MMIRKALNPSDWQAIRRICCETGKAGSPIAQDRWQFFGENWVGPYEKLLPEWTWVATSEIGSVVGYLTGCPDSAALEGRRFLRFDLPLLFRIARKKYIFNPDVRRYLKRHFYLEKSPERVFPQNVHSMLSSLYPAHLHINLSESARGGGTGRKLIDTYFEALRDKRVCGVHVYCGSAPVPFYERLGFEKLHTIEFQPGVKVHCLAIAL